jgi:hypothetical protein
MTGTFYLVKTQRANSSSTENDRASVVIFQRAKNLMRDRLLDEHIKQIEDRLNSRPRKCLDFQTSAEAYNALVVALAG